MLLEMAPMSKERSQVVYSDFLTFEEKCLEAGFDYPHGFSLPWSARDIALAILSRAILAQESTREVLVEEIFKNRLLSLSKYQYIPNLQLVNLCSRDLPARTLYGSTFSGFLREVELTNSELESAWDETMKGNECGSVFLPKSLPHTLPFMTSKTSDDVMLEFSGLRALGPVYESKLKETYSEFSSTQMSQNLKNDPIFATVYGFAVARFNIEIGNLHGIDPSWMASAPFYFSKVNGELATLAHNDIKHTDEKYIPTRFKEDMFCSNYWMFLYERLGEALCNFQTIGGESHDDPKSLHLNASLDAGAFGPVDKCPTDIGLIVFFVLLSVALTIMNFLVLQRFIQAHQVVIGCLSLAMMLLELIGSLVLIGYIAAKD